MQLSIAYIEINDKIIIYKGSRGLKMKKEINNIPLVHPTTICLVGTKRDENINFTTIGDLAVAGINPALVMISLSETHLATEHILESGFLSINIPHIDMVEFVDYCGIYSGRKRDKTITEPYTIVDDVPLLDNAPISLIVKVNHSHQILHRIIMICDVLKTIVDETLITENKLDLSHLKTIIYGLDNNYYTTGDKIGEGYKIGKKGE